MKNILRLPSILKLVCPNIMSQATIVIVGFIDLYFISRTGATATAAISLANITTASLYSFLDGFKTSPTILIARFLGANDRKNVSSIIKIGIAYALITGILVALLASPISHFIYSFATQDPAIQKIGVSYLYRKLLAAPVTLLFFSLTGFFLGFKNTLKPLLINLVICLLDGGLDYIFIYGKLGFPAMGINGAAVATLVAYSIGSLIGGIMLYQDATIRSYINPRIAALKSIKKDFVKMTIEVGFYAGFIKIAIFIFALFFSMLGSGALAAHQISYQIFLATFMIPKGFSTATSIIISDLIGAGKNNQIFSVVIKLTGVSLLSTVFFNGIIYVFAPTIATMFGSANVSITNAATAAIRLVCISQLFFSVYMVFLGSLLAHKDTKFIMWSEFIVEYMIFLPLTYVLAITMNYGILGGYVAFIAWAMFDALCVIVRFLTCREIAVNFSPARLSVFSQSKETPIYDTTRLDDETANAKNLQTLNKHIH